MNTNHLSGLIITGSSSPRPPRITIEKKRRKNSLGNSDIFPDTKINRSPFIDDKVHESRFYKSFSHGRFVFERYVMNKLYLQVIYDEKLSIIDEEYSCLVKFKGNLIHVNDQVYAGMRTSTENFLTYLQDTRFRSDHDVVKFLKNFYLFV